MRPQVLHLEAQCLELHGLGLLARLRFEPGRLQLLRAAPQGDLSLQQPIDLRALARQRLLQLPPQALTQGLSLLGEEEPAPQLRKLCREVLWPLLRLRLALGGLQRAALRGLQLAREARGPGLGLPARVLLPREHVEGCLQGGLADGKLADNFCLLAPALLQRLLELARLPLRLGAPLEHAAVDPLLGVGEVQKPRLSRLKVAVEAPLQAVQVLVGHLQLPRSLRQLLVRLRQPECLLDHHLSRGSDVLRLRPSAALLELGP
mmetsp:Transcript_96564/g.256603  ORF Transcript_96564/g.256603 Transcript_96564/m.256603 type:complete len:262 (-) Transcript_96564:467-1252(-)